MFRLTSNVSFWSDDAKEDCKSNPYMATEFVNQGTFSAHDHRTREELIGLHAMREYIGTWYTEDPCSLLFWAPNDKMALWFTQTVMTLPPNDLLHVTCYVVEFTHEKARLEYLRGELVSGRISYPELAQLQGLANHIEPGDVQLLEAAGVPEFGEPEGGCTDEDPASCGVCIHGTPQHELCPDCEAIAEAPAQGR